jgi:hypothetical protein
MAIDKDAFVKGFQQQIQLLMDLDKEVQAAIGRANKNLKRINDGEPIETVFGPVPPKQ